LIGSQSFEYFSKNKLNEVGTGVDQTATRAKKVTKLRFLARLLEYVAIILNAYASYHMRN
jgi:hypothetical protein